MYLVNYIGDKLIIGKFCQIASGVKFLMNGGNHLLSGISTYPFKILTHSSLADFDDCVDSRLHDSDAYILRKSRSMAFYPLKSGEKTMLVRPEDWVRYRDRRHSHGPFDRSSPTSHGKSCLMPLRASSPSSDLSKTLGCSAPIAL